MSKAKLNRKDFIFEKKKGETLIKVPGQINGLDFLISNLEDCEVYVMDHTAQIFVDDCKNCKIYVGPVESSLFIRECQDLKISAACSQYRVSDSTNIDSHVYSKTDPTLENCKNIRFAPYNFAYPLQDEHFPKAGLDPTQNKWSQVFDFNENRENPNWSIMPPEDFPGPFAKSVDDMSDPVNPVEYNVAYGGTLDEPIIVGSQEQSGAASGGMIAFDIKTGANQAQEHFEAHQPPAEEVIEEQYHSQAHEGHHEHQEYQAHDEAQFHHQEQNFQEGQNQGYAAHNQYDDDDFFSSQPQTQSQPQGSQFGTSTQPTFDMSQAYGGAQQGMHMYDPNYDPEEEERLERLRRIEQERNQRLDQKAREEREKKQEKIADAARALAQWHSEREQNINKQKQINKQNQQIKEEHNTEEEYKNPWDKIVGNIATKEGEYPGTKDVTRLRQSLINKKADAAKGVQKVADY